MDQQHQDELLHISVILIHRPIKVLVTHRNERKMSREEEECLRICDSFPCLRLHGLAHLSLGVSLLSPRSLICLSFLQVPSRFPHVVAFHLHSAAENLVQFSGGSPVIQMTTLTPSSLPKDLFLSWRTLSPQKRWPENSSKLTTFVRSSASTNRQHPHIPQVFIDDVLVSQG